MLPIYEYYIFKGKNGCEYIAEIEIYETDNLNMFANGCSATFKLFLIIEDGTKQLIYLIDNHQPFGFHEHHDLPFNHNARKLIPLVDWQLAWNHFQKVCKELI
jgi:hypothetical protein